MNFPRKLVRQARQLNRRARGSGPWQILPVETVFHTRASQCGWHEPERADGVIHTLPGNSVRYREGAALLGQEKKRAAFAPDRPRFLNRAVFPAHTHTIWSLSRAAVIGEEGTAYCERTLAIIEETARTITAPAAANAHLWIERDETARLPGTSLLMATPFGHAHYHFLWEMLPKYLALPVELRAGIDHFLISAVKTATTVAWLEAAGIDSAKVVWLTPHTHLRCEQLLFGNLPCPLAQPRIEIATVLRQIAPPHPRSENAARWLWISRAGQPARDLKWERIILAALPRFERVDLGALSPAEQMKLFSEASVVAGPHGSGFANLAFARSHGGTCIEIFPHDAAHDPSYERLSSAINWSHAWMRVAFDSPADAENTIAALTRHLATVPGAGPGAPL